ncbi:MAG: prepilin-type N-terminal cleavage/methylation domain-containing protein [Candidatus Omnitrophota bacterium]
MRKQGFSLIELLIACVLLSIGLVGLINAFSIGFSQSGQAKQYAVAKNLAEEKLEEIRNLSYANVSLEPRAPVLGFSDFERQVNVGDATPIVPGLKQVQIDVFWQAKGGEVSISLYSYVSDI